jgi:hypothetical protein
MRKYLAALLLVCALAVPAVAQAALPRSITDYSTCGRWANIKTVVYWSFPTSTTLKVTSTSTTVSSTHYGLHEVKCFHVQINRNSTIVSNNVDYTSHWISGMGSVTHSFYPGCTMPRTTVNRAGTQIHYVANADLGDFGTDMWSTMSWTGNFLN